MPTTSSLETEPGVRAMLAHVADALDSLPVLDQPGPWALLDWPAHGNVGDSAIWAGTLALLTPRFGGPPKFITPHARYPDNLDQRMPEGPVLLHGGGNFGDIWPLFHQNRVRLLREMRHRSIVQLPQSLHFQDPVVLEEMARAIGDHPDFTLMVRDRPSLELAQAHFDCKLVLCPDLAFGLERLISSTRPDTPVFSLLRDDIEQGSHGIDRAAAAQFGAVDDWAQRPSSRVQPDRRLLKYLYRLPQGLAMPWIEAACSRLATREVARGVDMLARGRVVLTDRLHAHILCVLLNKPHVVLDNSYGKIGAFIDTWPADGLTHRARGDLASQLAELVSSL